MPSPRNVNLREEAPPDVPAIREVHHAAFNGSRAESRIVDLLRERDKLTISLVYEEDGVVLGHAAYSPITLKGREVGIALGPLAVRPDRQNQGIGSKLILEGNAIAFDLGYENIFVLGDPGYYRRFEFELARGLNLLCKFDPEGIHFMILSRDPQALPEPVFVEYDKAFNLAATP